MHTGGFGARGPAQVVLRVDQSRPPLKKDSRSVFSYVKGIYSFGLMETNLYDQAEKLAKEVGGSPRCRPQDWRPWGRGTRTRSWVTLARFCLGTHFLEDSDRKGSW